MGTINFFRKTIAAATAGTLLGLTGCNGFFVPLTSSTGGSSSSSNVYIANSATDTLAGFAIGSGTLTTLANAPYSLTFAPTAVAVTPANTFVYVGGGGIITAYSINTNGSLTAANSGAAVGNASVAAMDISPDGNWLVVLDNNGSSIDAYPINKTTGVLGTPVVTTYAVAGATIIPHGIKIAPNGILIVVALGTGGDLIYGFNTTTGVMNFDSALLPNSGTTSENAVAIDKNSAYIYIARSGATGAGLAVYSLSSSGIISPVTGSPFATGTQPYSIALAPSGAYVYVANRGDTTISGFTIGTGNVLTAVAGSPFTSGNGPTAITIDSSGSYLLAASYLGAPDLSLYQFDSGVAGRIYTTTTAATSTGTSHAVAIAATH